MVQRSQFGSAKVKERDAGRPLLVLLLIAAVGLGLFLWLQDDGVEPVVTAAATGAEAESAAVVSETESANAAPATLDSGLAAWWQDVETSIYDAFSAIDYAADGECQDLEFAVEDLKYLDTRPEAPVDAAYTSLVNAMDRAASACRAGNSATVAGSAASARSHLAALKSATRGYGLEPAPLLEGL